MKLEDIAQELGSTELTPEVAGDRDADIDRGYASDLLSDVLAHAPGGRRCSSPCRCTST